MRQTIHARSEEETAKAAAALARELSGEEVLFLHGDLGAGKTAFARGLIRALAGDPALTVPSPTFTLLQTYNTDKGGTDKGGTDKGGTDKDPVWHFDLYRLSDPEEIYEIGWEEALAGGIVLVEWPDRLGALAPYRRLDITLAAPADKPDERIITIDESL